MKEILLPILLIIGCASPQKKSDYIKLLDYQGRYEYVEKNTIDIVASAFNTTLYAVIDKSKYPLNHIAVDSFTNTQGVPVIFKRDKSGKVNGYTTNGKTFNLITKDFEKIEMFPRKELFQSPENYTYKIPVATNDGLKTADLKDVFENTKPLLDMVEKTVKGSFPEVHSILIYKKDKLVLEEYFYGYDKDTKHQLRSATKPFIGGIVGITIDQGFVKNEDQKLLPFFASTYKDIANLDNHKRQLTIEDFLTYRHGMDCENNNPKSKGNEMAMMQSKDWVKFTLDLPMVEEPGKASSYCTGAALTLGSLVEIVTDKKIENFAKEHLFGPLGIENYNWTFEPNQASSSTYSQMSITPRDLIKLAKMYKDGGKWNGRQIISKNWVNKTFDMELGGYGYLWESKYFNIDGKTYYSYMASGNGGQKINIWPELDMITVFTGGNYNSYALYGKSTPPNEMIPKYILKALK